jgi:thiol-disulfide isomerase/thioredoxin
VFHGKFHFKGFVAEPRIAYITAFRDKNQYSNDKTRRLECFIEPGILFIDDTLGDFRYMEIQGSASDRDRLNRDKSQRQIMKRIDSVSGPFDECWAEYLKGKVENNRSDKLKSLMQKCDSLGAILSIRTKNGYDSLEILDSIFIVNNPASYVAAFMLMRKVGDWPTEQFPDIKELYDRFPTNIKETSYGESIRTKMAFEQNIYVGAEAMDFAALNSQGDTVRLIDFKNKKYVLLDFWGSWCHPCRQTTPLLVKINEKYKQKVSLISIAYGDKKDNWLAAIKNDHMTWTQILDNDSSRIAPYSGSITDEYYVSGFPSLILIDKNHKILRLFNCGGRNGLYAKDIDKELEKILQ